MEGTAHVQQEVGAGRVGASLPIRGEVKQTTPDTGWGRREGFKCLLDSVVTERSALIKFPM